jgi:nitroimidazol reductase NimA-like FMN-containing flavoprotein (pyridoxamine 5'-phosphate oxidase superfamily)
MRSLDPRTGTEHLDRDDCLRLLAEHQHRVGRLAVIEGTAPTIVVVNYVMIEDRVVFRSGPGSKLTAAERGGPAAFEIDLIADATGSGWSVVVRGHLRVVTSQQQLFMMGASRLVPYVPGAKGSWVMLHPDSITGRRVPVDAPYAL